MDINASPRKTLFRGARIPFACGVGVGILLAFPFAAPLMGTVLPDQAATLWGAALGAGIAVGGALWLAKDTQRTQRANASRVVLGITSGTLFALAELHDAYGPSGPREADPPVLTVEEWGDIRNAIRFLQDKFAEWQNNRHRIDAVLSLLSPEALEALLNLEQHAMAMMESVKVLEGTAFSLAVKMYPTPVKWEERFALDLSYRHIADCMTVLRAQAHD